MSTRHPLRTSGAQNSSVWPSLQSTRIKPHAWLASSLVAGLLGLAATQAQAVTTYDITLVGLYDSEHTSSSGVNSNTARLLNEAGQVAGRAARFNGSTGTGYSAWLYNGSSTQQIGLTGTGYTRSDGYQFNDAQFLNAAGQVAGYASRYNGSTATGRSAWLYNGSSTQQIGLTGAGYTRSDGYQYNYVNSLNAAGQVVGNASRYNGSTLTGQSAWLYNGNSNQQIGLTGTGYTRSDGYQYNTVLSLNDAGQVAGTANRYNGSTGMGESAWLYNGSSTQQIGLTGTGYTRSDGNQSSNAQFLNAAGQVAGYASRWNGWTYTGRSAWLYNGSSTQQIGLTGTGYTRSSDGYQLNTVKSLNDAGQVVGNASRYNGSTDTGVSAWLYNGSSTQQIGLTDAEHTRSDGYQLNTADSLNAVGQVVGTAERYNGSTGTGYSAWLYNGSSTQQIGLTGTGYTRSSDGYQYNSAQFLNAAGQVVGNAWRFNGSTGTGSSAWFYDSLTDQIFNMDASVSGLTGVASSGFQFLGDDGLALGVYTLYDTGGASLGNRAFSFTMADGWNDLGTLVNSGLNAAGWDYLAKAYRRNGAGQIIGDGVLAGMNGQAAYLLTPAPVPEPETWAMLLAGLGLVGAAVRRRKLAVA